ncbi:hypothetical protein [Bradyrhizobium sp. S3.3.6]|uniref:hypothetical protein n=1 Tax=Bradyrhizobium sp. S3.3.6 TaxID=3156429 RepID=UPI00339A743D
MKRRTFLTGGATAAARLSIQPAFSDSASTAAQPLMATAVESSAARLRTQFSKQFDPEYVENAILPFFLVSIYQGERSMLPMIDLSLTKENALPTDMWGLISKSWRPAPQDGVTVFLQGLDKRGPENRRKRIYMTAVTPDLYRPMFSDKVTKFFDGLLAPGNAGKPLMRSYLETFWHIYWDLHLGIKGDAIPAQVRQIGASFNTVLAYRNPTLQIVYENYMTVQKTSISCGAGSTLGSRISRQIKSRIRKRRSPGIGSKMAPAMTILPTRMLCSSASITSSRSANGAIRFTTSC